MSNRAEDIALRLNGKKQGKGWLACCPAHDDKHPSLSVTDSPEGKVLVRCHSGCSQASVMKALSKLDLWARKRSKASTEPKTDPAKYNLESILVGCWPLSHTIASPVLDYLAHRGLSNDLLVPDLLFNPRLKYWEQEKGESFHPALVAQVRDAEGQVVALHRTYLTPDGKKAQVSEPKKALGPIKGSSVQLVPCEDVLSICEGIETGLAVIEATGLPTWAAISAIGLREFLCPSTVKTVRIWADLDRSDTGVKMAQELASRLANEGKEVFIHVPNGPLGPEVKGIDWLDMLVSHGKAEFQNSMQTTARYQQKPHLQNNAWKVLKGEKKFNLISIGDLLKKPQENILYVVQDSLPTGGTSIWVGKPKAGKTTLIRFLALCVAAGRDFLGKAVAQGPVLYFALEEKEGQIKQHFADMGATGDENILIHASSAPTQESLEQLYDLILEHKPTLVIIDPVFKLVRVPDVSEYAKVNEALEPLNNIARQTGAHILLVHHMGKAEREGADGVLGSTAIAGAVDTIFMLRREKNKRTLRSQQRYGPDLEESLLVFDASTRTFTLGGSVDSQADGDIESAILMFLEQRARPTEEKEILEYIQGRRKTKVFALRKLVKEGSVRRTGAGRKGDTFKYEGIEDADDGESPDSCSHFTIENAEQEPAAIHSDLDEPVKKGSSDV